MLSSKISVRLLTWLKLRQQGLFVLGKARVTRIQCLAGKPDFQHAIPDHMKCEAIQKKVKEFTDSEQLIHGISKWGAIVEKLKRITAEKFIYGFKVFCSFVFVANCVYAWRNGKMIKVFDLWTLWKENKKAKCEGSDQTRLQIGIKSNDKKRNREKKTNEIEPPENEIRILLLGATGSGKSSAGNTFLGLDKDIDGFTTSCLATSETKQSTLKTLHKNINSKSYKIDVIDTSAVCDTGLPKDEEEHQMQIALALSSPGPHGIVLCIPATAITNYYTNAIQPYEKLFGENIYDFVIVVFTRYDQFECSDESKKKREFDNELTYAMGNNHILKKIKNITNNQIFLPEINCEGKNEQFDKLTQLVRIIKKQTERMEELGKNKFASCELCEHAEIKLKENTDKIIKSSSTTETIDKETKAKVNAGTDQKGYASKEIISSSATEERVKETEASSKDSLRDTVKKDKGHLQHFSKTFCRHCQTFKNN